MVRRSATDEGRGAPPTSPSLRHPTENELRRAVVLVGCAAIPLSIFAQYKEIALSANGAPLVLLGVRIQHLFRFATRGTDRQRRREQARLLCTDGMVSKPGNHRIQALLFSISPSWRIDAPLRASSATGDSYDTSVRDTLRYLESSCSLPSASQRGWREIRSGDRRWPNVGVERTPPHSKI